jgi:hypothetical protein
LNLGADGRDLLRDDESATVIVSSSARSYPVIALAAAFTSRMRAC